MTNPRVTIVVVPRERFSSTRESLESIYAHTDVPFKLVYVDGGSPAHVRRYLRAQAGRLGFQLIRTERYLSPNRARNLGLAAVDTDYVVFIDNDVVVADGWLGPLVRCAEETGAAVVGPLNCEYRPIHQFIHFAGGECHIVEQQKDGVVQRHMIDTIHRSGQRLADVRDQLRRAQTEVAEFHCLMVRTEIFRTIGPFDEAMLSVRENLDFCMSVVEAGGSIYVEPASVITYLGGFTEHGTLPLAWSDIPYYVLRWNDTWVIESLRHFRDKWRLTEDD